MSDREHKPAKDPMNPKTSVLIVDDDDGTCDNVSAILNERGYVSISARSGVQALEIVRIAAPDLVIIEAMLSGGMGVEVAISIRKLKPGCRIILYSGDPDAVRLRRNAMFEGYFFELLSKPLDTDQFIHRLVA